MASAIRVVADGIIEGRFGKSLSRKEREEQPELH
jgi:hypothetical protein